MVWKLLSLIGCVEDDAPADVKKDGKQDNRHPPVEYACFCFPIGEDEPPVFIPDGEREKTVERWESETEAESLLCCV